MKLKINFEGKVNKILFKEEYKTYLSFLNLLSTKTHIPKELIEISYRDGDQEIINIEDQEDIEFFLNEIKERQTAEITVNKKRLTLNRSQFSQKLSSVEQRSRRKSKNKFNRDDSHFDISDWSISMITNKKSGEVDEKAEDLEFKNLLTTQYSTRKKSSKMALGSLENLYMQLFSQMMEMKMNYENKLSMIEKNKSAMEIDLVSLKKKLQDVIDSNKELEDQLLNIKKSSSAKITERNPQLFCSVKESTQLNDSVYSNNTYYQKMINDLKNTALSSKHMLQCNLCKIKPIEGKRFICLICKNFNSCEECVQNKKHEHPLRLVLSAKERTRKDNKNNKTEEGENLNFKESIKDMLGNNLNKWISNKNGGEGLKSQNQLSSIRDSLRSYVSKSRNEINTTEITFGENSPLRKAEKGLGTEVDLNLADFVNNL